MINFFRHWLFGFLLRRLFGFPLRELSFGFLSLLSDIFIPASVGEPESQNASVLVAKRGVMVPGVPCVDHGNWGRETRHYSLFVTECGVLRRRFWQESRLIHSSQIQRCRSFSERIGPELYCLKASQVSKVHARNVLVRWQLNRLRYEFNLRKHWQKIGSQWRYVATAVII